MTERSSDGRQRAPRADVRRARRASVRLVLVSVSVTMIAFEILLRLFPMPLPDRFFAPNQDFGWFHIPGREGWQATQEYRVRISINEQGLRDSEHEYAKPADVYRILLLGDSFTEALQVPLQDTVGKRLEAALNADARRGQQYEVINGGVSRFGTDNELLFYQFEGRHYQPDLVVLLFYHNDVTDNVERPYFELVEGSLRAVTPKPVDVLGPWGNLRGWLWDQVQLYRATVIGAHVAASLVGLGQPPIEHRSTELYRLAYSQEIKDAWALTEALLVELDRVVAADSAQFVVVGIGDLSAIESPAPVDGFDWTRPNRELGARMAAGDIPYIDLLPAFQTDYRRTGETLHWPGDKHWNARGHRLAANTICAGLDRLDVLACSPLGDP